MTEVVKLWGGWSLVLPSPCQTTRNPDGSWSAWDESHVVDLSILEVGGRAGGGKNGPAEMLAGTEAWEQSEISGGIARVSHDTELTDTADGPRPIEWTRVHSAATNTALIMSIANSGPRDTAWHDRLWRSIAHSAPNRGLLGGLTRK